MGNHHWNINSPVLDQNIKKRTEYNEHIYKDNLAA